MCENLPDSAGSSALKVNDSACENLLRTVANPFCHGVAWRQGRLAEELLLEGTVKVDRSSSRFSNQLI